jgi:hypothetical protein
MKKLTLIIVFTLLMSPVVATEELDLSDLDKQTVRNIYILRYVLVILIIQYMDVLQATRDEGLSWAFEKQVQQSLQQCLELLDILEVPIREDKGE